MEVDPNLQRTLTRIRQLGCLAGVAINPATDPAVCGEAVRYCDYVLVMTVNPGLRRAAASSPQPWTRWPACGRCSRPRRPSRWTEAWTGTTLPALKAAGARTGSWPARPSSAQRIPAEARVLQQLARGRGAGVPWRARHGLAGRRRGRPGPSGTASPSWPGRRVPWAGSVVDSSRFLRAKVGLRGRVRFPTGGDSPRALRGRPGEIPGPTVKVWKREDRSGCVSLLADPWAVTAEGFFVGVDEARRRLSSSGPSRWPRGAGAAPAPTRWWAPSSSLDGRVVGRGLPRRSRAGPRRGRGHQGRLAAGRWLATAALLGAAARGRHHVRHPGALLSPTAAPRRAPTALIAAGFARVVVGADRSLAAGERHGVSSICARRASPVDLAEGELGLPAADARTTACASSWPRGCRSSPTSTR